MLIIEGAFEPGQDLRPIFMSFDEWHPAFITFNSEGGDLEAAMTLGRFIRALLLDLLDRVHRRSALVDVIRMTETTYGVDLSDKSKTEDKQ